MGGLIIVLLFLGFVLNSIATIVIGIEHEGRIPDLLDKVKEEGLTLIDLILIGLFLPAHLVHYSYYMIVTNHSSTIYDFFHKPRIKRG